MFNESACSGRNPGPRGVEDISGIPLKKGTGEGPICQPIRVLLLSQALLLPREPNQLVGRFEFLKQEDDA
jgi:hypothetical protein